MDNKCRSFFCGDLDTSLIFPHPPPDDPRELQYSNQQIEIIPFSWNGCDALHSG